jgi:transcriptional regulator with XRE-family HTH domain
MSDKNVNRLGQLLEKLRTSQGLSLRDASKKTDVSYSYLSQLENKTSTISPTTKTLQKLAKGYNYPLAELIEAAEATETKVSSKFEKNKIKDLDLRKILSDKEHTILLGNITLSSEEKEDILNYVEYIVNKRKAQASGE